MENESADWVTRQPVGDDFFFFKKIMTYSRGFQPCTHNKNNSKCLLAKSHAAEHHI